MPRTNYSSGAPWEEMVGYSRAVKIGNCIEVSGTTATENGIILFKNDPEGQTRIILQKIESALHLAGAKMEDVIRTRIYVVDISMWQYIARVHSEYFSKIKPATTMVEVSKLIDPDMLVEIEVTAILDSGAL